MTALEQFRKEKDEFFKNGSQSPLTAEQKKGFQRLEYFPENPAFDLELPLERFPQPEQVTLATSSGDERKYYHVGQVHFEVDGQSAALQVYEDDYGFFVPFTDASAPQETYGAGRYLEPREIRRGVLALDFNLAYNPYCAYNERWACPLPPAANRLGVRIAAGEKKFHN